MEAIGGVLAAGAARAVLGTSGALDADVLDGAVRTLGEKIVVALDVKGDQVMVKGWKEDAGSLEDLLPKLTEQKVPRFLITQIDVDGTMEGPDLALYKRAQTLTDRPIIASGGVHTADDLRALADTGVEGAIVGKAIYEGTINLSEVVEL
jgi:phosphoribosylformimino-5-aminoimidazole carboxamide ribonucleotide (ProFAR) isomerase